jgi:isoquinoline 1-oxidoreductase beta subunit
VAKETNFRSYRALRLNEMPDITVELLPSTAAPSGVGEPGVPPVAPALANAYTRLTGNRITNLPLFPGATMSGI